MEDLPVPLNRVELYLAKAAGMDVTIPEKPLNRAEEFLAVIAGDTSVVMPTPLSLTEQWLAYVAGLEPLEPLAIEGAHLIGVQMVDTRYFAVATGVPGATLPEEGPQNRAEQYWAHISGSEPGMLKYVTGSNLHLTDVARSVIESIQLNGDTFQQTYSGKNLFDCVNPNMASKTSGYNLSISSLDTGVRVSSTTTQSSSTVTAVYCIVGEASAFLNKTLTASADVSTGGGSHTASFGVGFCDANGGNIVGKKYVTSGSATFTVDDIPASSPYIFIAFRGAIGAATAPFYSDYTNVQIEAGSATSYEPYVGGIPSPNPDYPQDINVVTGEQTVTVSNGNTSQTYTIDLGSIELAKIDTYEDGIFNNDPTKSWYNPDLEDNAWYVHKEIGKATLVGTENGWSYNVNYKTGRIGRTDPSVSDFATGVDRGTDFYCNYFTPTSDVAQDMVNGQVLRTTSYFNFKISGISSLSSFTTWVSTHNIILYNALATPTDTKITDATLIGELEALEALELPKPIAYITASATSPNLPAQLKIGYYGLDE